MAFGPAPHVVQRSFGSAMPEAVATTVSSADPHSSQNVLPSAASTLQAGQCIPASLYERLGTHLVGHVDERDLLTRVVGQPGQIAVRVLEPTPDVHVVQAVPQELDRRSGLQLSGIEQPKGGSEDVAHEAEALHTFQHERLDRRGRLLQLGRAGQTRLVADERARHRLLRFTVETGCWRNACKRGYRLVALAGSSQATSQTEDGSGVVGVRAGDSVIVVDRACYAAREFGGDRNRELRCQFARHLAIARLKSVNRLCGCLLSDEGKTTIPDDAPIEGI